MATWEARYFGEIFSRPFPGSLLRWQDSDGSDLWVTEGETREQVIGFYRSACDGSTLTRRIDALPIDDPGQVAGRHPGLAVELFTQDVGVAAAARARPGYRRSGRCG